MKKIIILGLVVFFSIGLFSIVSATNNSLSGYIYSEKLGLISLSCTNTNSCQEISYGVNNSGSLSGYGFAQNGEWVNLNPNYGGIRLSGVDYIYGWAFSERSGWINLDGAKLISINDIKKDIILVQDMIKNENLSSIGAVDILNSLCLKFLNNSECSIINY